MSPRLFFLPAAAGCLLVLAACATNTSDEPLEPAEAAMPPAEAETTMPETDMSEPKGDFERALYTVASLEEAGNEQAAIDRLTQLLGNPELTTRQQADALYRRAQLRYGEGHNVYGAISDLDEMLDLDPDHARADEAREMRDTARGEATSLNFMLETGDLSRTERFETLFRLGEHQKALDLMLSSDLTPSNAYLVDLYQMGYLCEGAELTGRSYQVREPDGTARSLKYCEFGK
ncbi:MAG: hypothetical protein GVY06_00870 [Alphaproteobacteria bacterium]|jgi:tetratricopeptide (TPR) repeat protein|nr:hypothetical protein [Alphaproteobacteria bacterium]